MPIVSVALMVVWMYKGSGRLAATLLNAVDKCLDGWKRIVWYVVRMAGPGEGFLERGFYGRRGVASSMRIHAASIGRRLQRGPETGQAPGSPQPHESRTARSSIRRAIACAFPRAA